MNKTKLLLLIVTTAVISAVFTKVLLNSDRQETTNAEKKPLYWVAPMDANYRRDQPGKSPMGMDLVPVYEESDSVEPGVVNISSVVENNLGVKTALVEKRILNRNIVSAGVVQYDQEQIVHIHPRVSGWVEQLYVKAKGNKVKKGQALYTLYSPQLVNAQEEYLIALSRNNQGLISAAYARLESLKIPTKVINKLTKSKQVQTNITFYAPQSGVVDNLNIRTGFYVQPGTTMMSIVALDSVWVESHIAANNAGYISVGQPVSITSDYYPKQNWQGEVDYIYPSTDVINKNLRVRVKVKNRQQLLKANMYVNTQLTTPVTEPVVAVPYDAVIQTGKQNRVVLALGEGKFKSIAVKLGQKNDTHIEITEGLEEGELVVTSAQFLIDSESSKSSDFKRMDIAPSSVWMSGEVIEVDNDAQVATLYHQAVPEWQWPDMTMDFPFANAADLAQLKEGQSLHFEVQKQEDGSLLVTAIHIMEMTYESAEVTGVIEGVDADSRVLTIFRSAIEKWGREPASVEFLVADDIDISRLKLQQQLEFTFEIRDDFVITKLALIDDSQSQHHH